MSLEITQDSEAEAEVVCLVVGEVRLDPVVSLTSFQTVNSPTEEE